MSAAAATSVQTKSHPFASIPTRDYVTDAVSLILLLVSLGMPWTVKDGGLLNASDVAWVLPATLLSVLSLALPYLARFGAVPATWTVHSTRKVRVAANLPLAIAVVAQYVLDVADVGGYHGVGTAAALGLAGAALAASPRSAELGPLDHDRAATGTWWRVSGVLAALSAIALVTWIALFIVGFFSLDRAPEMLGWKYFGLRLTEIIVVGAIIMVPIARALLSRSTAWRNVSIALAAVLVVLFFLSAENPSHMPVESLRSFYGVRIDTLTGAGILFVPAFGAIMASPAVRRGLAPAHPVTNWLTTANASFTYVSVTAGGLIVLTGLALADGLAWGVGITAIVLLAIALVLGRVADRALLANIANGRRVAIAVAVLIAVIGIALLSSADVNTRLIWVGTDGTLTWAVLALAFGLPIAALTALTVPSCVREFFDANPPSSIGGTSSAYEWSPEAGASPAYPAPPAYSGAPQASVLAVHSASDVHGAPAAHAAPSDHASTGDLNAPATPASPASSASHRETDGHAAPVEVAPPATAGHVPAGVARAHQEAQESSAPQTSSPDRVSAFAGRTNTAGHDESAGSHRAETATGGDETAVVQTSVDETMRVDLQGVGSGFTAEIAADPATPAAVLAQIVEQVPSLRPHVAGNPSTYPALVEWLRDLHDPEVDAALSTRS